MIDILLATYNGEKYLDAQIESLFEQSYKNWRIIAHDDGSTDSTPDILRRWHSEHPDKFIYLDDGVKTGGAKNNFAYLATQSTSPYIMFCDQDDVWLNNKIELTFSKMLELEAGLKDIPVLVHTDLCVVDEALNTIAPSMMAYSNLPRRNCSLNELMFRNNVTGCTVLANRAAISLIDEVPENAVMHDWWLALIVLKTSGVVGFVDQPLILYRQHGTNSIGAVSGGLFGLLRKASFKKIRLSNDIGYKQAKLICPDISILPYVLRKVYSVLRVIL